ncbi:hypothetical protein ACSVDE_19030 [Pseudalkalibacillus sp. Hm43]|uniref:hypothetical protein n=1 Tax=Pseudalkalibacillus sp. Hm43 TaxID=3450742 RepID=UPI003F429816
MEDVFTESRVCWKPVIHPFTTSPLSTALKEPSVGVVGYGFIPVIKKSGWMTDNSSTQRERICEGALNEGGTVKSMFSAFSPLRNELVS